jgi:hypothetical protein
LIVYAVPMPAEEVDVPSGPAHDLLMDGPRNARGINAVESKGPRDVS